MSNEPKSSEADVGCAIGGIGCAIICIIGALGAIATVLRFGWKIIEWIWT
jgi:hypothetical protein